MGKPATRILGAALAAVGALALFAACGSSNIAEADKNPVRTYTVPSGTVVCIYESEFVNSTGVSSSLSCDWDHVIPKS